MLQTKHLKSIILAFCCVLGTTLAAAQDQAEQAHADGDHHEEAAEEFNAGDYIMHHITDSYEWHFGEVGDVHLTLPLPMIFVSQQHGVEVYSSSELHHHGDQAHSTFHERYAVDHGHIERKSEQGWFFDISITRNVFTLFLSMLLLLLIFIPVARRYKRDPLAAPKGMQSLLEPVIIFVRDDIAKENIGPKYERFMPYLLTIFFYIWLGNLLGLLPLGINITGSIAVTFVLAIITFLITTFSGNKHYWQHIFNTPGVPWWLKFGVPIMPIVEFIGMFTKPFSLMVRLFANITAGHIIILALIGLIFITQNAGWSFISIPFTIFMYFLELLVAAVQAYVFTLLSAIYFGGAVEEHHHEEEVAHG